MEKSLLHNCALAVVYDTGGAARTYIFATPLIRDQFLLRFETIIAANSQARPRLTEPLYTFRVTI